MVVVNYRMLRWLKLQRPVLQRRSSRLEPVGKARGQQICLETSLVPDDVDTQLQVWQGE